MNSFHLRHAFEKLLSAESKARPFVDTVVELGDYVRRLREPISELLQNAGAISNLQEVLNKVGSTTSSVTNRSFFAALDAYEKAVSEVGLSGDDGQALVKSIKEHISVFAEAYDRFLVKQHKHTALALITAAADLSTLMQRIHQIAVVVGEELSSVLKPEGDEDLLQLWLPSPMSLKTFGEKLLAIQAIYSELCMLMDVSEAAYPLKIAKVESGSLLVEVLGNLGVIGYMQSVIKDAAGKMFRMYTTEGKVEGISHKTRAISDVLDLRSKMVTAGVNPEGMDDNIAKAALKLSENLVTLIEGEASVTVNKEAVEGGTAVKNLLLQSASPPRLENKSSE